MATRSVATVFGGSGFIGRYVVKRLTHKGFIVRVAVRDPEAALFLKTAGGVGQVVPLFAAVENEGTVRRALEGAALVVNLVGILAENRAGDFQRVHAEGAARIARLATATGVERLVHLSAIGADPAAASLYGRTKGEAEAGVRREFSGATVLRPSIVFGPEDRFFNRFAAIARMSPFMPVICGDSRMQPVYVGDVADAVMAALGREDAAGAIYELGGPRVWTFRELLHYVLHETQRHKPMVGVPLGMARLQIGLTELAAAPLRMLGLTPSLPLTRDQLLMLSQDNVVQPGMPGLPELGIVPTPVELVVPQYLRRFRRGGGRRTIPRPAEAA